MVDFVCVFKTSGGGNDVGEEEIGYDESGWVRGLEESGGPVLSSVTDLRGLSPSRLMCLKLT